MKQWRISLLFVLLLLSSITGCAMFSKPALMETTGKGDIAATQTLLIREQTSTKQTGTVRHL